MTLLYTTRRLGYTAGRVDLVCKQLVHIPCLVLPRLIPFCEFPARIQVWNFFRKLVIFYRHLIW